MNQPYFVEIFEGSITEFKNHLIEPRNERIIFSGKYGIGKTQFLRDFFEMQKQSLEVEKYNVIHLFPVNYSIANNEDIQRYIKYDIILELLGKEIKFDEIKSTVINSFGKYFNINGHKIAAGIVSMIPYVGKEIVDCFDRIDGLKEEFLKYHSDLNEKREDKLFKYIEDIESKEGSVYENDITTKIITETIKNESNKISVLIIDDLDRLDPEHAFRIMNIFASHFDLGYNNSKKNKFNFDKIILVCDINNLRNIFHHKYGGNVDFNGYIDKFYSTDIFRFDNSKAINEIIHKVIDSINVECKPNDNEGLLRHFYFANMFVDNFIKLAISQQLLSFRSSIKLFGRNVNYHYEHISFDKENKNIPAWRNPILLQIKLLKELFGETRVLIEVLEKLKISEEFFENHKHKLADLLYTLSYKIHNFYPRKGFIYKYDHDSIFVEIQVDSRTDVFQRGFLSYTNDADTNTTRQEYKITEKLFRKALIDVIVMLNNNGFLK